MQRTFLNSSFPFLHDYENALFRELRRTKASNDENLFLFLSLDMFTWNSASGGFAYS